MDFVRLIDNVCLAKGSREVAAVFEVERSTFLYSGIVRLLDLALGTEVGKNSILYLVAPDNCRDEVEQQLCRPCDERYDGYTHVLFCRAIAIGIGTAGCVLLTYITID